MNRNTKQLPACVFFSAEDACRFALAAYYTAVGTAQACHPGATAHARRCPPLAPDSEHGVAPSEAFDAAWFLGLWMQDVSAKLAADDITSPAYAEIIRRWGAGPGGEKITPDNEQFAGRDNGNHNHVGQGL